MGLELMQKPKDRKNLARRKSTMVFGGLFSNKKEDEKAQAGNIVLNEVKIDKINHEMSKSN
jgi:hypothetical protein